MIFAQFYQKGVVTGKLIEACGDRAVIILDGRRSLRFNTAVAAENCAARGYIGYTLFQGDSFTRCTAVSSYIPICLGKLYKTDYLAKAMSLIHAADYKECAAYWEMLSVGYKGTPEEVYHAIAMLIEERKAVNHDNRNP